MRKSLYVVLAKRGSKRNNATKFSSIFLTSNYRYSSTFSSLNVERAVREKKNSEDFRAHPWFVFYQKNGETCILRSGFNSHREIRTIYLTTTYPRFQRGGGRGEGRGIDLDRVRSSLGQVTDCVTSLEIRSADYIEVKWNPFLAGRQRTLSILRKLETRVQGLERSILTRLHRIIRDDK